MRRRKAIAIVSFVLLALHTGRAQQSGQAGPPLDVDAYAVLRVLFAGHWPVSYLPAKRWVIQQEAAVFTACADTPESAGADWQEAVRDYQEKNRQPHAVEPNHPQGKPYVVVPKAAIDQALSTPDETFGWKSFNRRYPNAGGFIQVSAVGFNRDRSKAVVYVGHHCGGLCGGGRMFFLERHDDAWRVTPVIRCWWES